MASRHRTIKLFPYHSPLRIFHHEQFRGRFFIPSTATTMAEGKSHQQWECCLIKASRRRGASCYMCYLQFRALARESIHAKSSRHSSSLKWGNARRLKAARTFHYHHNLHGGIYWCLNNNSKNARVIRNMKHRQWIPWILVMQNDECLWRAAYLALLMWNNFY